ncbi:glycosyltransferase [Paraflavisolibacter sp. H34]|uniref:glycosyltransferase family 2 protein n=1 Tax=Huijunlia imazamoxiresistens TaxID=3127457 RepID=UPI003015FAF2
MTPENLPASAPKISIIIPCYNNGQFLARALESVREQDHAPVEVIVVDDGSTDDTNAVAARYPEVIYLYQRNQGVSAARNTGIDHCTGAYVLFLDADDWLLPGALSVNLRRLRAHPAAGFVSGAHVLVFQARNVESLVTREVTENHYHHLLQGNYIGMLAAVLFRRRVLEEFRYDTSLRGSEDYDLFLRIARRYPVLHHTEPMAAYRIHETNTSGNVSMMLRHALQVLRRQQPLLEDATERQCLKKGRAFCKRYYHLQLYRQLRKAPFGLHTRHRRLLFQLLRYDLLLFGRLLAHKLKTFIAGPQTGSPKIIRT